MKVLIAIPALNEEKILQNNIEKIFLFCQKNITDDWQIVIADNQSTDQTSAIGKNLDTIYPNVSYLYINQRGKGLAIKQAWHKFTADVYCFMDADLATNLEALPKLIAAIKQGADIAIGSRYHKESKVERSFFRKIFSWGYKIVLKIILKTKINDAPCGFKAISHRVKEQLLGQVEDNSWFFDSELVLRAEKAGYKISEIPVDWQEPRDKLDKSKVSTFSVSLAYLKKVLALKNKI